MKRHFIFLAGEQASGKTFQITHAVRWFAARPQVHAVFVCDRLGEYVDEGEVFTSFAQYVQYCIDKPIPRVCVFCFGMDRAPYYQVEQEAIDEGNVCLVIDEAWEFSPSGSSWRGGPALKEIVFAGRHLPNRQGKLCKVHLVVAAQYPRRCHLDMHQQANCVLASSLEGENARDWVKQNFKPGSLERVDKLQQWEWTVLRSKPIPNKRPEWLVGAPR